MTTRRWFGLTAILSFVAGAVLWAQATHIHTSGTLPATCAVGDIYTKTGASLGFYACTAANTWTGPMSATTGTVTSVAMSVPAFLSVSGSPVTGSGTLAVTLSGTALPFANGGTGLTSAADDTVLVSSSAAWVATAVPDCTDVTGNHLNYTAASNAFSCGTSGGGGGTALSGITAATGGNTIASGNNSGQVWNWSLTTADTTAFTFGETSASTAAGTSSLVGMNTLASSTLNTLYIKNYGGGQSLKIDDVASDTTPFVVTADGNVGIQTASPTNPLVVTGQAQFINGSISLLVGDSASYGSITSNSDLRLATNGGTYIYTTSGGNVMLRRPSTPTGLAAADSYLRIGNTEDAVNGYYNIMFGYNGNRAYMGFQETGNSGQTIGDLVFGVRSDTTSGNPTEALRIVSDHTVNVDSLKTTGSATGKNVVCVDTATGKLYASSTGTDCSN